SNAASASTVRVARYRTCAVARSFSSTTDWQQDRRCVRRSRQSARSALRGSSWLCPSARRRHARSSPTSPTKRCAPARPSRFPPSVCGIAISRRRQTKKFVRCCRRMPNACTRGAADMPEGNGVEAVRRAAIWFEPGPDGFGALLERIGDAALVLIGEASHGTHEFYQTRAELTKALILHKGFNLVAVEADWPDAY